MADFATLIDSELNRLTSLLNTLVSNPEYLTLFTAFVGWLLLPILRFRVRIDGRRPGVQTYLPNELTDYLKLTRSLGEVARAIWTGVTVYICFAVALSINIFQQLITTPNFPTLAYAGLFALIACVVVWGVWITTGVLWELAPKWIERKRRYWKKNRSMGDIWRLDGWTTGWELEDVEMLCQRKAYPSTRNETTALGELLRNPLELLFWGNIMLRRIPHIYQYRVEIAPKGNRYLDFVLLDPKTGEPVLGIETDELSHFVNKDGKDDPTKHRKDLTKDRKILDSAGIPTYRIPYAYFFRGHIPERLKFLPGYAGYTPEAPDPPHDVKNSRMWTLDAAEQLRDWVAHAYKEKRKLAQKKKRWQTRQRWLTRLLCYLW